MPNKSSHKSHLFSRIFKNFLGIVRGTTKAVWRPNHGQVIYVHLCYNAHMREWENLQTTKEAESFPKKMFSTMQVLTVLRIRTPSPENLQTTKEAESFPKKMFSTMQVLTVLRIRTPSLRTSKFELKKKPNKWKQRDSMYAAALQSWSRSFVTLDHRAPDKLPYFPNKRRVQFFPHILLGKWS